MNKNRDKSGKFKKKLKNDIFYQDDEIIILIIDSPKYGKFGLTIDIEDYDKVSQYRWGLNVQSNEYKRPISSSNEKGKYFVSHIITNYKHVDHIDGNPFNNRKSNLRESNKITNGQNRGKNKNNKAGYKGVSYNKRHKTYSAELMYNRKRKRKSGFKIAIETAKQYNKWALKYHGEFACLNEIPIEYKEIKQ